MDKTKKILCGNCRGHGCQVCNWSGWIIDNLPEGEYEPAVFDVDEDVGRIDVSDRRDNKMK